MPVNNCTNYTPNGNITGAQAVDGASGENYAAGQTTTLNDFANSGGTVFKADGTGDSIATWYKTPITGMGPNGRLIGGDIVVRGDIPNGVESRFCSKANCGLSFTANVFDGACPGPLGPNPNVCLCTDPIFFNSDVAADPNSANGCSCLPGTIAGTVINNI